MNNTRKDFWEFVKIAGFPKEENYRISKKRISSYNSQELTELYNEYCKLVNELDLTIIKFIISSWIKNTPFFKDNKFLQYLYKWVLWEPNDINRTEEKYSGIFQNDSYSDVLSYIISCGEKRFNEIKNNPSELFSKSWFKGEYSIEWFAYIFN